MNTPELPQRNDLEGRRSPPSNVPSLTSEPSLPSYVDDLSDRLLTGEEAMPPVDPLDRVGRRLWLMSGVLIVLVGLISLAGMLIVV